MKIILAFAAGIIIHEIAILSLEAYAKRLEHQNELLALLVTEATPVPQG